ncbi:MAG: hypothetical protein CR993_00745 [Rhodobacterales bacterium]|nr:MAG: hypothetical protein CR993_00745 [Rhodobacterales bacterium]
MVEAAMLTRPIALAIRRATAGHPVRPPLTNAPKAGIRRAHEKCAWNKMQSLSKGRGKKASAVGSDAFAA